MFKTSKYEYSTASSGSYNNERGNYNEINKLDTLLNDLEHERTATLDRSTFESFYDQIFMNESRLCPHFNCNLIFTSNVFLALLMVSIVSFTRLMTSLRWEMFIPIFLLLVNRSVVKISFSKNNFSYSSHFTQNFSSQTNEHLPTILASIQVYCEYCVGIHHKFS